MTYNYNSNRNGLVAKACNETFSFDYYAEEKVYTNYNDSSNDLNDACDALKRVLN